MTAATSVTDGHLIRLSTTQPEAFGAIFGRYAPVVHRYLARRIGGSLADDLTAESFLIAFRGWDRYDPAHENALPWLYGIAANLLRGHQRAEPSGPGCTTPANVSAPHSR